MMALTLISYRVNRVQHSCNFFSQILFKYSDVQENVWGKVWAAYERPLLYSTSCFEFQDFTRSGYGWFGFILGTLYLSSVYYTVIRAYDECMSNVVLNAKLPVSTFKHFYCIHKYQNQHLLSWYNMKINCIFQEVINKSVAKLYVYYGNLLLHWNMSRTLRNNKLVNRPFVKTAQIIM